jgi:hypothetical protein
MLYSSIAKFHIRIIPTRWYKDCILTNLNFNLENSPILTAIESATDVSTSSFKMTSTFQTLQNFHDSNYNEIVHQNIPQRNRFGIAFSTAKTAINIALETNSDRELVQILKEFIAVKRNQNAEGGVNDNYLDENNGVESHESNQNGSNNNIIPLQRDLIRQISNPNVTKIRGAPSKKRIKSAIEVSKRRVPMQEINDNQVVRQ